VRDVERLWLPGPDHHFNGAVALSTTVTSWYSRVRTATRRLNRAVAWHPNNPALADPNFGALERSCGLDSHSDGRDEGRSPSAQPASTEPWPRQTRETRSRWMFSPTDSSFNGAMTLLAMVTVRRR